jgi:hypothetical protein
MSVKLRSGTAINGPAIAILGFYSFLLDRRRVFDSGGYLKKP